MRPTKRRGRRTEGSVGPTVADYYRYHLTAPGATTRGWAPSYADYERWRADGLRISK